MFSPLKLQRRRSALLYGFVRIIQKLRHRQLYLVDQQQISDHKKRHQTNAEDYERWYAIHIPKHPLGKFQVEKHEEVEKNKADRHKYCAEKEELVVKEGVDKVP